MKSIGSNGSVSDRSIKDLSKVAKNIEPFAKKASREIKKGSYLGYFYISITLILVAIFTIMAIGIIIGISLLFPEDYKWLGYVVSIVPLLALLVFAWKSLAN